MKIERQSSNDRASCEFASHSSTESNASVAPRVEEIEDEASNSNSPEIIEHSTPPPTENISSTTLRLYPHYIFFSKIRYYSASCERTRGNRSTTHWERSFIGKTTLPHLLKKYLEVRGTIAFQIDDMPSSKTYYLGDSIGNNS